MPDPRTILSFDDVTVLASDSLYDAPIWDVRLALRAGELALVRLERGHLTIPLADAGEGLVEPDQGTVSFVGEDWQAMSPQRANEARGSIGRVFADYGWISDLQVDENIT